MVRRLKTGLEMEENAMIVDMPVWESKANSRGRNNTANRELSDNRFSAFLQLIIVHNYCTLLSLLIVLVNRMTFFTNITTKNQIQ